ncbi:MAG: DUF1963 domain-containing protein [Paracoccaceae bacterium]
MMKRLISAVLILIAAGAAARGFWLKEFAEVYDTSEMITVVCVMIAAMLAYKTLEHLPAGPSPSTPKSKNANVDPHDLDAFFAEMDTYPDTQARGDTLPGWALHLRSPFEAKRPVTSWIGGVPVAPPGFNWPRDRNDEVLHFVAQIDLRDLKPEPETGQRPALPEDGAVMVFITERLNADESQRRSYTLSFIQAMPWNTPHQFMCPKAYARSITWAFGSNRQPFPFGRLIWCRS